MTILFIHEDKTRPSLSRIHLECDSKISTKCLQKWSTRHIYYSQDKTFHQCRNCVRAKYASAGGKVAGPNAVKSGQIRQFIEAGAACRDKAQATLEKRGKFISKVETRFYQKLLEWFQPHDVIRWFYLQTTHGKRNVDFYVKSINVLIEVDGVYWHGLDRPYDSLTETQKKKFDNDRLLDEFCKLSSIRLVRFTDVEVNAESWDTIRKRLY